MIPQLISFEALESSVQSMSAVAQSRQVRVSAEEGWFERIKAYAESGEFKIVGQTAVIEIRGVLGYRYDFWTWLYDGSSYTGIMEKVRAAADDSRVQKIVLAIDSPGGTVMGCMEASKAIYEARAKKEVVAVVDPEAASAGYWLASQASRIVCLESGWVGSVGCETDYRSLERMMTEAGIDYRIVRSAVSPEKNLGHPYEPLNDEATAYFQSMCDTVAADFIAHVARGRGVKESQVAESYGKGRMLLARQALVAGMIDSIGGLSSEIVVDSHPVSATSSKRVRAAIW